MKAFYKTILVLITGILLQSCAKTYEFQFDILLLTEFHDEFKCPEYLENCRVEIKTKDKLDIIKYISSLEVSAYYSIDPDYERYARITSEGICGEFCLPYQNTCDITIYNEENSKILNIIYNVNKGITSITTWENDNLKCQAKGSFLYWEELRPHNWSFESGIYKLYYSNEKLEKEIKTKDCKKKENCFFKQTTIKYYLNGKVSHKKIEKAVECEECPEAEYTLEVIEDTYFNEEDTESINTENYSYQEENNDEYEDDYEIKETYTTKNNKQSNDKPSWLVGSWRTPLGDTGALIVNVNYDDASVWIMNGVFLESRIDYEDWTVFDDMLYLINNGEKLKDSPSFYIDYNNRTIIGHGGERFQKH